VPRTWLSKLLRWLNTSNQRGSKTKARKPASGILRSAHFSRYDQVYRQLTTLASDRQDTVPPGIRYPARLTRQADELGHLDRITEARAAAAEVEMIGTDMLPSTHS
jgi:hypothetical protein